MNSINGEAVIDNWTERALPPVITGVVVFLFTRLWDAWQFEKKLTEIIKIHLAEFKDNHVAPLKERVSKFDQTVVSLQHDLTEVKTLVAAIAAKLEVKGK